jgi:hypothetical protein
LRSNNFSICRHKKCLTPVPKNDIMVSDRGAVFISTKADAASAVDAFGKGKPPKGPSFLAGWPWSFGEQPPDCHHAFDGELSVDLAHANLQAGFPACF